MAGRLGIDRRGGLMTAIPRPGTSPPFSLICDDCGRNETTTSDTSGPETWQVLWSKAQTAGWRGRGRPIGPHCCPVCATASTTDSR
jgi:hypothetical protein